MAGALDTPSTVELPFSRVFLKMINAYRLSVSEAVVLRRIELIVVVVLCQVLLLYRSVWLFLLCQLE